jgi:YD repeat-containing protein
VGFGPISVGHTNKPAHIGRVLDDGTTQLYTYEYNGFGNIKKIIDPVGRTFSYDYDNGNDSQTTTFTYNARGQVLTEKNALGETTTYHYDANGYRLWVEGPSPGPGTNKTTWTYDAAGRIATTIDVSGYTLTFDYDDLDRLTTITFPDSTFNEYTYTLLDLTTIQDRAGWKTTFEYNGVRRH